MTPPPPGPNDFPRELLAAYADGELDAPARAAVERWLAAHPDALDDLQTQRDLSPANVPLWERAEPPEPSSGQWAVARVEIEHRLGPPAPGRSRWRSAVWAVAGLATAGVAAMIAWATFGLVGVPRQDSKPDVRELARTAPDVAPAPREVAAGAPEPRSIDPLDGFAILPMATDAEVVLDRVPEFPAGWLPVGQHPLPGQVLLATEEEILLAEVAPSDAWPMGTPKMTMAPGDAPMIFAPKLR